MLSPRDDGEMKHLVLVGLGNPGKKYEMTRHNIGFLVIDSLAVRHGWKFKDISRFEAKVAKGVIGDAEVHLLKPATYMNLSGRALIKYLNYFQLGPETVAVAADDAALPFGTLRLRLMGSSGGHNGLKSIEQYLGTQKYVRLRLGIAGRHLRKNSLEDYVLEDFSKPERKELPNFVEEAALALERLTQEQPERVMNDVNTKVKKEDDADKTGTL